MWVTELWEDWHFFSHSMVLKAPSPAPSWLDPMGFQSTCSRLTADDTENCSDMIKLLSVFCSPQSFGESRSLVGETSPPEMHLSFLPAGGLTDVKAALNKCESASPNWQTAAHSTALDGFIHPFFNTMLESSNLVCVTHKKLWNVLFCFFNFPLFVQSLNAGAGKHLRCSLFFSLKDSKCQNQPHISAQNFKLFLSSCVTIAAAC